MSKRDRDRHHAQEESDTDGLTGMLFVILLVILMAHNAC